MLAPGATWTNVSVRIQLSGDLDHTSEDRCHSETGVQFVHMRHPVQEGDDARLRAHGWGQVFDRLLESCGLD